MVKPKIAKSLERVTADDITVTDEIVLTGVDVHIEAMDDRTFWVGLYRPDGTYLMADFFVQAGRRKRIGLRVTDWDMTDVPIDEGCWK